jgi:hypothetical protein
MFSLKRFKANRLIKKAKSMQQSRIHSQPSDDVIQKERAIYYTLAGMFRSKIGKKKWPFASEMVQECYRAAASIEDQNAQYTLAQQLIEEGKFRQSLQEGAVFASTGNERRMNLLFEEGLAYVKAAENLGHIKAKRLHGLCYINGWGVEADKKRGFDLVVESIDKENSWDKVPQIFAEIGLNKPEFFSQLTQMRNKS